MSERVGIVDRRAKDPTDPGHTDDPAGAARVVRMIVGEQEQIDATNTCPRKCGAEQPRIRTRVDKKSPPPVPYQDRVPLPDIKDSQKWLLPEARHPDSADDHERTQHGRHSPGSAGPFAGNGPRDPHCERSEGCDHPQQCRRHLDTRCRSGQ